MLTLPSRLSLRRSSAISSSAALGNIGISDIGYRIFHLRVSAPPISDFRQCSEYRLGQFQLVVLAQAVAQGVAAVPQVVDLQFPRVRLLLRSRQPPRLACDSSLRTVLLRAHPVALAGMYLPNAFPPLPCTCTTSPATPTSATTSAGSRPAAPARPPTAAPPAGAPGRAAAGRLPAARAGRRAVSRSSTCASATFAAVRLLLPAQPRIVAFADLALRRLQPGLQRLHLRLGPRRLVARLLPRRRPVPRFPVSSPLISSRLTSTSSCNPSRRCRRWPIRSRRSADCSASTSISSCCRPIRSSSAAVRSRSSARSRSSSASRRSSDTAARAGRVTRFSATGCRSRRDVRRPSACRPLPAVRLAASRSASRPTAPQRPAPPSGRGRSASAPAADAAGRPTAGRRTAPPVPPAPARPPVGRATLGTRQADGFGVSRVSSAAWRRRRPQAAES